MLSHTFKLIKVKGEDRKRKRKKERKKKERKELHERTDAVLLLIRIFFKISSLFFTPSCLFHQCRECSLSRFHEAQKGAKLYHITQTEWQFSVSRR